jgi:hypothetical protein
VSTDGNRLTRFTWRDLQPPVRTHDPLLTERNRFICNWMKHETPRNVFHNRSVGSKRKKHNKFMEFEVFYGDARKWTRLYNALTLTVISGTMSWYTGGLWIRWWNRQPFYGLPVEIWHQGSDYEGLLSDRRMRCWRHWLYDFKELIAKRTVTIYRPKVGQTNQNLISRDF